MGEEPECEETEEDDHGNRVDPVLRHRENSSPGVHHPPATVRRGDRELREGSFRCHCCLFSKLFLPRIVSTIERKQRNAKAERKRFVKPFSDKVRYITVSS